MILRDINRRILFTVVTLVVVSTVFARYTYAAFKIETSGETTTIKFGDIEMSLCDTSTCDSSGTLYTNSIGTRTFTYHGANNEELQGTGYKSYYPISDPDSTYNSTWNNMDYYKFDLKNTGDLDLYVSIYLENDTTSNLTYTINHGANTTYTKNDGTNNNSFTESGTNETVRTETFNSFVGANVNEYKYFKVALLLDGTTTPSIQTFKTIYDNDYLVASNISLPAGQTKTYYLYIWLSNDETVDATERTACNNATTTYESNPTSENLTAMNTACAALKSNDVIGKHFVTELYARGEYRPAE